MTKRKGKNTRKEKQDFRKIVNAAFAGKADEIDKIITAAGYIKGHTRLRGKDIAEIFGETAQAVSHWPKRESNGAGKCPKNDDGTYNLQHVIEWYVKRELHSHGEKLAKEMLQGTDAEIYMGGNSPMLEKLREQKYIKEKRQNELDEGRIIEKWKIREQLGAAANVFRTRAEAIRTVYGPDIAKRIDEMLDEAFAAFRKVVHEQELNTQDGKENRQSG